MSEITRFFSWDGNGFMHEDADGDYVLYEDHKAEVERMREDAERYRWLRSSQADKSVDCIASGVFPKWLYGPELDKAVDDARRKSSQEGGRDE